MKIHKQINNGILFDNIFKFIVNRKRMFKVVEGNIVWTIKLSLNNLYCYSILISEESVKQSIEDFGEIEFIRIMVNNAFIKIENELCEIYDIDSSVPN